jgi:hypothetical protein
VIVIGFISGVISGMGIGGGTVLIPVLTMLFGIEQKTAQTINLLYFIPTAIVAIITHSKNKMIECKVLPLVITGGAIGAVIGSVIAMQLNNTVLSKLFSGFLLIMGIKEVWTGWKKS